MSAKTSFSSALDKMAMAIRPMYDCWGFGSSGPLPKKRGSMPLYPGKPGNSVGPPVGGKWVKGRGVAHSGFKNLMRSAKAKVYNC